MPYREDPPALAGRRRGAHLPLLACVTVAAPCPVAWADMVGDERVRYCRQCDQQVFDTAAMTTAEVEALIATVYAGGRVCARLHRRPDGTLITRDCREARRRRAQAARRLVAVAGVVGAGLGFVLAVLPAPVARTLSVEPGAASPACAVTASAAPAPADERAPEAPAASVAPASVVAPASPRSHVVRDAAARARAIEAAATTGLLAPGGR